MPKPAQVEVKNKVRGMHVMECHGCQVIAVVPQVKEDKVGSGQGQTGGMCMGQDIGGVTPQNQRLHDVLRLMGGLEPMQLLQVRQVLGEQVGQARGVPEMFGQRATKWISSKYGSNARTRIIRGIRR